MIRIIKGSDRFLLERLRALSRVYLGKGWESCLGERKVWYVNWVY